MGWILLLAAAVPPAAAQHTFYACGVTARDYVVGARLPPSGLFAREGGVWTVRGYRHPYISALDYDARDPGILYLAAGNGCIRASGGGRHWRVLTAEEVTELRDVAVDRNAPGHLYFAHTAGVAVSRDGGRSWRHSEPDPKRPYVESIRVDRQRAGHLVAGGERGLFFSSDAGMTWRPAGASGFQILHIEQSPSHADDWLATTMQGGVFRSGNGGRSFENLGNAGVAHNLYDCAYDPTTPARLAVAGWSVGVLVSDDNGKTWKPRNQGLPRWDVWSIAFDPDRSGRLYAGVHEEALYVSDDAGLHWRPAGLEGSVLYRLRFVPEAP